MNPVLRGAILMTIAASSVSVDTIIIRYVSADIHPFEIAFFRNLFSLIVLAPWIARSGLAGLKTTRMPLHVARAALKLAALICFFYVIKLLPLAVVTSIAFTTPLFVSIGSMALFGERAHLGRLMALAAGFSGVLIIVRPGTAVFDPNAFVALAAAIGLGGVGLLMKYLSVRENPPAVVSLNLLLTVPIAFVVMLPVWSTPSLPILGLLVVQGILGGVAQLCFSRAMSLGDASVLIPIEFVRLPLVTVLAFLIYGETTEVWTIVGGVVIFAATIALVHREQKPTANEAGLPT